MRLLSFAVVACLGATMPIGCAKEAVPRAESKTGAPMLSGNSGSGGSEGLRSDWGDGGTTPAPKSEAIPARKRRLPLAEPHTKPRSAPAVAEPSPEPRSTLAVAEAVVGVARHPRPQDSHLKAGLLTAGSFDDNLEPRFYQSFLKRLAQSQHLSDLTGKLLGQRLLLVVKDEAGKPLGNARVKLSRAAGVGAELVTRSDGRAVFVLSWDGLPEKEPLTLTVTPPNGGGSVTQTIPPAIPRWEVTLPSARAQLPRYLDLAIVLDTTGSMADELEYLKSEIRGITAAVRARFPEVEQRFALVLYRDDGDEYVTRPFDFTASLDTFHKNLAGQKAAGGGDYPEAMHRGLEEATQLRWREQDAARVLFLIGDAPPHAQHIGRTMSAADLLRKQGVAIYPIACSGYDPACEAVMRACGMLTGSQFVFLTDDSGVGNSHDEPHIPFYQVEHLNQLMARLIASELSGRRVEAGPGEIIRAVGKKVN